MKKIRLYLNITKIQADLTTNIANNDFCYLIKVMRKKLGDKILVFNGIDGLWLAQLTGIEKKHCQITIIAQITEQYYPPKITLAFAPVKNARIDFVATTATELGTTKFQPIITNNTIVDKINLERFSANIKEAAEQCQRLDLPPILKPIKLTHLLKNLTQNQLLILCDESGNGKKASDILPKINSINQEIIIITGPEGGFSTAEFAQFNQLTNIHKINLGPRILRADTAIISALTLVQEFLGDFNLKPNLTNVDNS
jgi:16S rRNA (uracil1498-N3)-methyltransferase